MKNVDKVKFLQRMAKEHPEFAGIELAPVVIMAEVYYWDFEKTAESLKVFI